MTTSPAIEDQFQNDVDFLQLHGEVIILSDASGAKLALMPHLQGRVMTSTAGNGESFGWINRSYFEEAAAGKINPHISPFGGEDRFWIGPEGGQYSIFFKKGDAFEIANWKTPPFIDTDPFDVVRKSESAALFQRVVKFENYSGTAFHLRIDRNVRLLNLSESLTAIGVTPTHDISGVALESENTITNLAAPWSKRTGLLSIWVLSMLNASPTTTVAIPYVPGEDKSLGRKVNGDYFGAIASDRLKTIDDVVYFKADARSRGKLGISPKRARPIVASFDSAANLLTLCIFTFDKDAADYVNSAWSEQSDPYNGDVINSYNDGPPVPGQPQMGNFYEIETSSAAHELQTGESISHAHRIIHLTGDRTALDQIALRTIGVGLDHISGAFE